MSKVEPNLYDHEERIVNLEGNVREIQEDLRERYARIDESNKYLRELSQEQIKQNGHILNSVLTGNQEAAKRQDEMKKAAAKTRADLWLKAIGSGGVFYLIVDMIMNELHGACITTTGMWSTSALRLAMATTTHRNK